MPNTVLHTYCAPTAMGFDGTGYSANSGAGVLVWGDTSTFAACNIYLNTASTAGGGVYVYYGQADLSGCNIYSNTAAGNSGGTYGGGVGGGTSGVVSLTGCEIYGNTASYVSRAHHTPFHAPHRSSFQEVSLPRARREAACTWVGRLP